MIKYLFKLKKDGEIVGYLKIDKGLVCWRTTTLSAALNKTWCTVHNSARIDFDSAHPFVTRDKNGKDVFADDEVVDSMGNRCLVMWHKVMFQWCLWHIEGDYYFGSLESGPILELIEDKEDEAT